MQAVAMLRAIMLGAVRLASLRRLAAARAAGGGAVCAAWPAASTRRLSSAASPFSSAASAELPRRDLHFRSNTRHTIAAPPVVYHPLYSAPQLPPGHTFPMQVFGRIHQLLLEEGTVEPGQVGAGGRCRRAMARWVQRMPQPCVHRIPGPHHHLPTRPCRCTPRRRCPAASCSAWSTMRSSSMRFAAARWVGCVLLPFMRQFPLAPLRSAAAPVPAPPLPADDQRLRRIGFGEVTRSQALIARTLSEVAGTILTAELALAHGLACNAAGGERTLQPPLCCLVGERRRASPRSEPPTAGSAPVPQAPTTPSAPMAPASAY